MYDSSSPLLLQPDSGIHPLNYDPLLLPDSSLCLTSIAPGFSTWVSLWGSSHQPHAPTPTVQEHCITSSCLATHSKSVTWIDLVVAKLMLVHLSRSLMHMNPSPNKECPQQDVSNTGGEERYDYKV
jgi:hypothetical protein